MLLYRYKTGQIKILFKKPQARGLGDWRPPHLRLRRGGLWLRLGWPGKPQCSPTQQRRRCNQSCGYCARLRGSLESHLTHVRLGLPPRGVTTWAKSRAPSWTELQSWQNILLTKWNQEPRQTDLLIQSPSAKGKISISRRTCIGRWPAVTEDF